MHTHKYLMGPDGKAEFSLQSEEGVVGDGKVDVVDEDAQHLAQLESFFSVAAREEDSELQGDKRERCRETKRNVRECALADECTRSP